MTGGSFVWFAVGALTLLGGLVVLGVRRRRPR
ncbi:LPXTG cell wall anchor domain-containing protein [Actinopolymorpha sp. B9G3]